MVRKTQIIVLTSCSWPSTDYHKSMEPLRTTDTKEFSTYSQALSIALIRKTGGMAGDLRTSIHGAGLNISNNPTGAGEQTPHHLERQKTTPRAFSSIRQKPLTMEKGSQSYPNSTGSVGEGKRIKLCSPGAGDHCEPRPLVIF